MSTAITIRPGRLDDLNDVIILNKALIQYEHDNGCNPTGWANPEATEEYFRSILSGVPEKIILLADSENGPVGYLNGSYSDDSLGLIKRTAKLVHLYVADSVRKKGVGKSLVDAFVDWSRKSEAELIQVSAFNQNDNAFNFYESQGFTSRFTTFELKLK